MSEKILKQLLEELKSTNNELSSINTRLDRLETEVSSIKSDTADIPLIRRATLETLDEVKEANKKTAAALNTHEFGIDILNREQLKLKTEIEKLKNR